MNLPTLHIADVTILGEDTVTLWRVRGIDGVWYPTKIAAETCARARFPDEDAGTRYGRTSFKAFVSDDPDIEIHLGKRVKTVDGDGVGICTACAFLNLDCTSVPCQNFARNDGRNVYFKEIK